VEALGYAGHTERCRRACIENQAGSKLVKQHLRHFDEEKSRAIGEKIARLLAAGFI
jgi:hypothetical protein